MHLKYGLGIVGLTIGLLYGCGGGGAAPTGHLIDGQKPSADELADQIRQQHKIHVSFAPTNSTTTKWYEIDQKALSDALAWKCGLRDDPATSCQYARQKTEAYLCVYRYALDIMEVGAQPFQSHVSLKVPGSATAAEGEVTIPRQSVDTVAVLAEYLSNTNLLALTNDEYSKCKAVSEFLLPINAHRIIDHVNSAYELTEEMTNAAIKAIPAAADGVRSSAPPGLGAEKKSWTQPILSRSAVARMMLGGRLEWHGFADGFCPGRNLSAGERKAMEFLRTSGVSIVDLANSDLKTNDLLHSSARNAVNQGSVAMRLSLVTGSAKLATTSDLPGLYGLTESDFSKARQYLVAEADAFARDRNSYLPQDIQSADKNTIFHRYAATTMPSSYTPDEYFGALARERVDSGEPGENSLAGAAYAALQQSNTINQFIKDNAASYQAGDIAALQESATSGLMKLASTAPSVLQTWTFKVNGADKVFLVYSTAEQNDTRKRSVVLGEPGMRCALFGNDGGLPCTTDSLNSAPLLALDPMPTCSSPYANCFASGVYDLPPWWGSSRAYVIHPKSNSTGGPGGYEVEFGFFTQADFSTYPSVPTIVQWRQLR